MSDSPSGRRMVRALVGEGLVALQSWEPLVVATCDEEGVHQLRVIVRRLRTQVALLRDAIPAKALAAFRGQLRAYGSDLGVVRDLDVHLAYIATRPWGDDVLASVREDRVRAGDAVRRSLCSPQLDVTLEMLATWAQAPPSRRAASRSAVSLFVPRLASQLAKVTVASDRYRDDAALHRARINVKHARYGVELAAACGVPHTRKVQLSLVRAQSVLGELHDRAVMRNSLESYFPEGVPAVVRDSVEADEEALRATWWAESPSVVAELREFRRQLRAAM